MQMEMGKRNGSYDSQKFSLNKGKITRDNVDSLIEKME